MLDLILLILVLLSTLHGWRRGFWLGLLDLLGWVGGLLLALRYYQPAAVWLGPYLALPPVWAEPVAFLLVAIIANLGLVLVGYAFVRLLPRMIREGLVDRLFGLAPGAINGLVGAAILAYLLLAVPLPGPLNQAVRDSVLANRLAATTGRLETYLSPIFHPAIEETLNMLTVQPRTSALVDLPPVMVEPQVRPDLETEMLHLVNRERIEAGLSPLAQDPALTEVARRHSADMLARSYFSHVSPDGADPFERIQAAGVSYITAGENLAIAPTVSLAHTNLMNSPDHRDNILRPDFHRAGVGIQDAGPLGLVITQLFRD